MNIGDLQYEYEIEYEYDFCNLVLMLSIASTPIPYRQSPIYLTGQRHGGVRALATGLKFYSRDHIRSRTRTAT